MPALIISLVFTVIVEAGCLAAATDRRPGHSKRYRFGMSGMSLMGVVTLGYLIKGLLP